MKRNRRFRVFADFRLQTAFCLRIVFYWIICQATLLVTVFAISNFEASPGASTPASPWRFIAPALITSTMVLPIVLLDSLFFSNKFAGPMKRLHGHLNQLNSGTETAEIHFRKGDYFQNICDGVNQLASQTKHSSSGEVDMVEVDSTKGSHEQINKFGLADREIAPVAETSKG